MKKEKIIKLLLILFMFLAINNVYADENEEVVSYATDVTVEMTNDEYWINKLGEDANKILLDYDDIAVVNENIIIGDGTGVFDITTITEKKTQAERKDSLSKAIDEDFNYMINSTSSGKIYVDGELVDNETFVSTMKTAIKDTGFENNDEKVQLYAVGVKRTTLRTFPTDKVFGYDSPNDTDDEASLSSLDVNEPFVIRAKCVIDGETYYWGFSNNLSGWVNGKYLAIFNSKEEWLEAWKVSLDEDNFIVVIEDSIPLELADTTQDVELKLGTVLKLVDDEDMPDLVDGRETINNYVVYLPTRDEEGKYVKEYALIPEHYDVNVGYLPLTQENILKVAFNSLGDRYGWGGMLDAMDCSSYVKSVYKVFGLDLPRNTTSQKMVPEMVVNISGMSDEDKEAYIETLPVGTGLYFPGHATIYIGSENGKNYVISATGSLSDSVGKVDVRSMNSIIVNPLTARRRNGTTWLTNITHALVFDKSLIGNNNAFKYDNGNSNSGNIIYADGINNKMSDVNYWLDLLEDNKVLSEIEGNDKSLLVVTQDRIILEPSLRQIELSKKELQLGTILKLVPKDEIPRNIYERGPWNNYVVEINDEYALISEHNNVSIGYLPLTEKKVLKIAFGCLGNSSKLMNNKIFVSLVYKSLGLDIDEYEEKEITGAYISELDVGSVIKTGNKYAIYIGKENNNHYIISSNDNSVVISKLNLNDVTAVVDLKHKKNNNNEIVYQFLSLDNTVEEKNYTIVEGANQIVKIGKEASFVANVEFDVFSLEGTVYIDNIKLEKEEYSIYKEVNSDMTRIVLSSEYLKDLEQGKHTFEIRVKDKTASTTFTLEEVIETTEEIGKVESIKETKNMNIKIIILLCLLAIIGYLMRFYIIKKKL